MLSNLYLYGVKIGSSWGWNPSAREGWMVAIVCLFMVFVASLVVSRIIKLLIVVGVIAVLMSAGLLSGAMPG